MSDEVDYGLRIQPDYKLESSIKHLEKRIQASRREQDAIGVYNFSDPGYQAEERNIDGFKASIDRIRAELHRRTKERIERERRKVEGQPKPVLQRVSKQAAPKALEAALASWFRNQRFEPSKHLRLSWEVEGRQFIASWAEAPRRLEVWIVVKPGTADAIQRDGLYLMPCDTFGEQGKAKVAEGKRPKK